MCAGLNSEPRNTSVLFCLTPVILNKSDDLVCCPITSRSTSLTNCSRMGSDIISPSNHRHESDPKILSCDIAGRPVIGC